MEIAKRIHFYNLKSFVNGLWLETDLLCRNHEGGYYFLTYHSQPYFHATFIILDSLNDNVKDPPITEKIQSLKECLSSILSLNQRMVDALASSLNIPVPIKEKTLNKLERVIKENVVEGERTWFSHEFSQATFELHQILMPETVQCRALLTEIKETINSKYKDLYGSYEPTLADYEKLSEQKSWE